MVLTEKPLEDARRSYRLGLPKIFEDIARVHIVEGERPKPPKDADLLMESFPHTFNQHFINFAHGQEKQEREAIKVGVVLSGGQSPGGHNVIVGLYDALQAMNLNSTLIGFLEGPIGILKNKHKELTGSIVNQYRNQGGFDMIGSGRDKIETEEDLASAERTVNELGLHGLVIIGGDDSNTNAALLAERFKAHNSQTCVVGVPKTIDGDLKNQYIETSFGFDTACRVYADLIGNIQRDCLSSKKYYHFIKLMGRSASHITLECALQTHTNMALISEEVSEYEQSLTEIVGHLADVICERAAKGKNYGVVLVPEGLIEFIPSMKVLISELNDILSANSGFGHVITSIASPVERICRVTEELSERANQIFSMLPTDIQSQLLMDRDPHGNVQVSRIATEQMLLKMVARELERRKGIGRYVGDFSAQHHFFGYEGRCAMPTNFDCHYCYALGYSAAVLLNAGKTGYMACVSGLTSSIEEWKVSGVPLPSMMAMERRHGQSVPVIKKALVDLEDAPFKAFKSERDVWASQDLYRYPGPIQYYGGKDLADQVPLTLRFEHEREAKVVAHV
ncbi:Pyrophosphate--fructose 6-phosphate 1-phosphotransferase [Chlamydiales bacterium SCGC AG-110-M15]|nr:Pyrophosphate--fructose 6-phosphate 1-phosphotransferase [Chlamydiales bacterium SCGC AG-110-M15]